MKKFKALLLAGVLAVSIAPLTSAQAFCDESEGCSPCDSGPHLIVDGKNTRVEWRYC